MSRSSQAGFASHLVDRLGAGAAAPPALIARVQAALGDDGFAAVLAPRDADGVASVLAFCTNEGWPVVPIGAATWQRRARGPAPDVAASVTGQRPPIVLSTLRLDGVTEHEPADLVIGVQAGIPLERLNRVLSENGQWLPLDPPSAPDATIGAIAGTGAAGPLRAGHGTPRDMALGIELVTGDGRVVRFGGRVVKNVAGYDGVRLAIGSAGTLGVITGMYLRVRGAPHADRTLAVACGAGPDGARRGAELALAVRDAFACDALELISPTVARRLGQDGGWLLLVRVLGGEHAVAEGMERVRRLAAGGGAARYSGGGARAAELPASIWRSLAALEADATVALRLTGAPTSLAAGLAAAESDQEAATWMCAAHAADGVIRLWGMGPNGPGAGAGAGWLQRIEENAATGDWTVRYDVLPAGLVAPVLQPDPAVRELTKRLRSVFDPAGVLRGPEELS